jgi:predicted transcriptional regulator
MQALSHLLAQVPLATLHTKGEAHMKTYSEYVIDILDIAHANEGIVQPTQLDGTATHGRTAHNSRVGYMNRLCKAKLLEKVGDPKDEQYKLTKYGAWVQRMVAGGWSYENTQWSNGDITLDTVTADMCQSMGIAPVVSDLLKN